MPREQILPTVAYGWYYFSRTAADNRKIITNSLERETFRNLLTAMLVAHGMHAHFVYVDETEMHLGIRAGADSLSKTLGSFCERFAHKINRSRNEKGSLFRPHAHVLLVQPGRCFVLLGRYIHWIPRLKEPGAQANGSQFNSDTYYRNHKRTRGLETSAILRMVSHGSRNTRVQDEAYRRIFDQPPPADEIELFRRGSPADPRMVGDKEFIVRTFRDLGVSPHPRVRARRGAPEQIPGVVLRMLERFSVLFIPQLPPATAGRWLRVSTLDNVCSKCRQPPLPMLRALVASQLVTKGHFRLEQLESFFHCRPRTLSAGRRQAYQAKFEALFNQTYQVLFHDTLVNWSSAMGQCRTVGADGVFTPTPNQPPSAPSSHEQDTVRPDQRRP